MESSLENRIVFLFLFLIDLALPAFGCIFYIQRVDLFPIKGSRPALCISAVLVFTLWGLVVCIRNALKDSLSCIFGVYGGHLLLPLCAQLYCWRCWFLWYDFHATRDKIFLAANENYVTSWASRYKWLGKISTAFYALGATVALQTLYPIVFTVNRPDFSASDGMQEEDCQTVTSAIILFAFQVLYCVLIFVLAVKLRSIADSLGLKDQLMRTGVIFIACLILSVVIPLKPSLANTFSNVNFIDLVLALCPIPIVILNIWIPVDQAQKFFRRRHAGHASAVSRSHHGSRSTQSHNSYLGSGNRVTLESILSTPEGFNSFKKFLMTEFSVENVLFCKEVEEYRVIAKKYHSLKKRAAAASTNISVDQKPTQPIYEQALIAKASRICTKYIMTGAPLQINLSAVDRRRLMIRLFGHATQDASAATGAGLAGTSSHHAAADSRPHQTGSPTSDTSSTGSCPSTERSQGDDAVKTVSSTGEPESSRHGGLGVPARPGMECIAEMSEHQRSESCSTPGVLPGHPGHTNSLIPGRTSSDSTLTVGAVAVSDAGATVATITISAATGTSSAVTALDCGPASDSPPVSSTVSLPIPAVAAPGKSPRGRDKSPHNKTPRDKSARDRDRDRERRSGRSPREKEKEKERDGKDAASKIDEDQPASEVALLSVAKSCHKRGVGSFGSGEFKKMPPMTFQTSRQFLLTDALTQKPSDAEIEKAIPKPPPNFQSPKKSASKTLQLPSVPPPSAPPPAASGLVLASGPQPKSVREHNLWGSEKRGSKDQPLVIPLDRCTVDLFDGARNAIFRLMNGDSFVRYLSSDFYKQLLGKEVTSAVVRDFDQIWQIELPMVV